jgi:hypothetical protein
MSVLRQLNLLSQQRLDVRDVRALESSIAADFDVSVGRAQAGEKALVVRGFTLGNVTTGQASTLQLVVADSIAYNVNASEAGSFIWIPATQAPEILDSALNTKVIGGFTPGAANYIGLDWVRETDSSTTDVAKFRNIVAKTEVPRSVPLGRTLSYRIHISTVPFSSQPHLTPIARVQTSANNNRVTDVVDARNLMFRLGRGGDSPSATSAYSWPQGRTEGSGVSTAAFYGADRGIRSLKDWMDAVMHRLWEVGGGEKWYTPALDHNVQLITSGAVFANGEYFEWDGTHLHWTGLTFLFDNSTGIKNEVANQTANSTGLTNLADGECIYVDLDRTTNHTSGGSNALVAQKTTLAQVGSGTPPGSRWILAWRNGSDVFTRGWRYAVGTTFTPATNTSLGVVKLSRAATNNNGDSVSVPIVIGQSGGALYGPSATSALVATGGAASLFNPGGAGYTATGGAAGTSQAAGSGVYATGGASGLGAVNAGHGVHGVGGTATALPTPGTPGDGVRGESGGAGAMGVRGIGANAANSWGVRGESGGAGTDRGGVYGAGSGTSDGVRGVAGASIGSSGVKGTAALDGAFGVQGVNTAGVGVKGSGAGSGKAGVYGESTDGAGNGVYGISSGQPGVQGFGATGVHGTAWPASGGKGVWGIGDSAGSGVHGDGGTSSGAGVTGVGGTSNGHGVVGTGTGTGRAFHATAGDVGIPTTAQYEYTGTHTGVIIVPLADWSIVTPANGLTYSASDGTVACPHLQRSNSGGTTAAVGRINLPRGAEITAVDVWCENGTAFSYNGATFVLKRHLYTGTGTPTTNTIVSSAPTANVGVNGWVALSGVSSFPAVDGRSGNNNSSMITGEVSTTITSGGTVRLMALRITYTYTQVDFMV